METYDVKRKATEESTETKETLTERFFGSVNGERKPLPDFEALFTEDSEKMHSGVDIVKRLLLSNAGKILVSLFLYVIKHAPQWIMPLIVANVINALTSADAKTAIIVNAVVLAVTMIIHIPAHVFYSRYADSMLRNISAGMRCTLIRKLQHLSISFHREIESGKVQSKFLNDIAAIETLLNQILKSILPNFVTMLIYIGLVIYKSPLVSLFFLAVIPVNVLFMRLFRKSMREKNSRIRHERESMSAQLTDMLNMLPVTKAHGLEDEEITKLERTVKSFRSRALEYDFINSVFGSTSWLISQIFNALCLFFTAFLAMRGIGGVGIGDIVLFHGYFSTVTGTVNQLVNVFPELTKGVESTRSLAEIILSKDVEDSKGKIKLRYVHGHLKFENVCFRYPDAEQDTIHDFNLHVQPGECIAFVGSSGSGKSTIMNMIIGFLMPKSGQLLIDGKPIEALSLSDYRHFVSVVPQNSILMTGTIHDNITYGMPGISEETIQKAVEMANLNEFLSELPNGLDTVVGEHGDKLSGGQKQRICIARALIRDPKILILDEATSALDNISEFHVQKAISSLIKGRTTFIVAHRLSTIRDADRIVVMENGTPVEIGSYDELMEKKGKFYELKSLSDMNVEDTNE